MEEWGAALYGDPCHECGFGWSVTADEAIERVAMLPSRLTDATAGVDGRMRRPTGGWSVSEYVTHVGDNLRMWAERVQSARIAGVRRVGGYDPDALSAARRADLLPLPVALWSAGLSAAAWVDVVRAAVDEAIELDHETRGLQRAEDVARNNCHDAHHHFGT